jgi:hypothetical protein
MATASGGACVDNGWGGSLGDYLRYNVALPVDFPQTYVTLRYARQTAGNSLIRIQIDGNATNTVLVQLPSTGDWGFNPGGWQYAQAQLPGLAQGSHLLELRSQANNNNVNFDGFYLSAQALSTNSQALVPPPSGPSAIAPLGAGLSALPCKTPVAIPYSRLKAYVDGSGLVQSLLGTPSEQGIGGNVYGPSLHVMLAEQGPWSAVEQSLQCDPVPAVVTRLEWTTVAVEQSVFAATPEAEGFYVRVTVTNKTSQALQFALVSLLGNATNVQITATNSLAAPGQPLVRMLPSPGVAVSALAWISTEHNSPNASARAD